MNLGQSIRKGVKWLVVGDAGAQMLQFAFGIVLARLLVPEDFGMIITIQGLTGFVSMFATGGMGQSLIRAKEVSADDFSAVFTLQLALGILIYAGFFLASPWVASFFANPLYEQLLRVSALSFLLRPFTIIRSSWLTREMQFKKRSLVDLAAGGFTGISSVLMAAAGMGVWSLTLSGLAGGLFGTILFFYVCPIRLRLHLSADTVRRHSGYGLKITANDFIGYLTSQSIALILSKMAGAAFLGLFNKAESLARMPNRLITPPTCQTVFRAMSKVQDDLDQTKYMFYRTITLLMVYISPCLVGLWWVAEPFIGVVYGSKWLPAAEPIRILVAAALLRTIGTPCGVLLAAQNRLLQEMAGQILGLGLTVVACLIGLTWGLEGVAWAFLACSLFATTYNFVLVYRTIPTRMADLVRAVTPALLLNVPLLAALAITHSMTADLKLTAPALYLVVMSVVGLVVYASAFLFLPIPALRSEAGRWRQLLHNGLSLMSKATG